MSDFADFHKALMLLVSEFDDIQLRVESDTDNDIIKIFGERFSSLARAKNGLDDMTELSLTATEHHPYWNLLYSCCQICCSTLEKWDDKLTADELDQIRWSIGELNNTLKKLIETDKDK